MRLGLIIAALSVIGMLTWLSLAQPDFCSRLTGAQNWVNDYRLIAYLIVLVWSFFLFLTIMPLGTTTILIAGFFLGPSVGAVQFVSLVAASAVLYEIGREKDEAALAKRVAQYPALLKIAETGRKRGLIFSILLRLAPVVPSAVASLTASFFGLGRPAFYGGTLLAGWVRPVGFATLAWFAAQSFTSDDPLPFLQEKGVCASASVSEAQIGNNIATLQRS